MADDGDGRGRGSGGGDGHGPSPGTVVFVGGFVTGLFLLAAGLAYTAAPGVRAVSALALALAGLAGVVLLVSLVTAGVFWWAGRGPVDGE